MKWGVRQAGGQFRVSPVALALAWAVAACAPAGAVAIPTSAICAAAGAAAARAAGLPPNMLLAVGVVESGRADRFTGRAMPWPWTVNVDGAGSFFDNEADAASFARLAQSSGAGDVDVGCFQVSLRYHPEAFASLDQAFDPVGNANFAAGYLVRLKARTGSWGAAIAAYHSAAPALGLPYQRLVLAAWRGLGSLPDGLAPDADFDLPGNAAPDLVAPDLVVIEQAPAARLVRVFTLNDPAGAGLSGRLPRVITP